MIKFADQIAEEIEKERKENPVSTDGCVTGEEYEKWMRRERKPVSNRKEKDHGKSI